MGVYLNSKSSHRIYSDIVKMDYFVDKTAILGELLPLAGLPADAAKAGKDNTGNGNKYICITRPRRFGKTTAASMIASFFGSGKDSSTIFDKLDISKNPAYKLHLNKHNVIYISFNEMPDECGSYKEYITRIKRRLVKDLCIAFPDAGIEKEEAVWDALTVVYEHGDAEFIFVLDEWDYIFHQDFITNQDKKAYIKFLSNLLKDKGYVEFAYMTGILPVAKYSSGSELNMFYEYTMATEERFSRYFGFIETEVDAVFAKYLALHDKPEVTRDGLKAWYDGYYTKSGERVYNPRSVVAALSNNNLGNYWTSSGPYDEIFFYIKNNVAAVRDDLALMVAGIPVQAKVREYAATCMELSTKDEIFSAMVVYGFLSYNNGYVSVPNKELMDKFDEILKKESSLGYVFRLAKKSAEMLKATLAGDACTVEKIMEFVHDTESPLLAYNSESDLVTVVNLVYLEARDAYRMEREDKAGTGYADFIFYPETDTTADAFILELKVDDTAENAIKQIKDKKYALAFEPKAGAKRKYTGQVLGVGIAYNKKTKRHTCKIEVLRKKQHY